MRAALVIALKDLRQRLRDRSMIVVAFVAPLGLALIVSAAFGGGFTDSFDATYAVVDADGSEISRAFTRDVLGSAELRDQVRTRGAATVDAARELVAADEVSSAFVIPAGFGSAVSGGRRAQLTVLTNPDAPVGSDVAQAIARAFVDQVNAGRLAVLTTTRAAGTPPTPEQAAELAALAARTRMPVQLVDGSVAVKEVSGASYFGPAMAVFFLFFTTSFAARSLLTERELGTMPRVLAAPVRAWEVILGKGLTGFAVGVLSLLVMFLTFGLLLDIDWGDPLTIAVLSVATVVAVMGVTALVQSFARTQEQADSYASMTAVVLALIGGSFFPIFEMPEVVQRISVIAPNAWALRGFTDIVYDGAGIAQIAPNLFVIAAFALVTGGIAVLRARRTSLL